MKIAILGAVNVRHMTLISHYINNIDLNKHQVDLIYVDKYNINESIDDVNMYKFSLKINPGWSYLKKAIKYYKFKPFAEKIIKRNNYDLIIVWGSYTAHLFKNFLLKEYRGKYILNIRDYFYENHKYVYLRIKKLIDRSLFTTISSDGFKTFLPASEKLYLIHSMNSDVINDSKKNLEFTKSLPIKISFIGNNRFYEVHKKFMTLLKNDERFQLQYFGTGSNILKKFAEQQGINNVKFREGFHISETKDFLDQTDIINNIYGNNNIALDTALSIRLYYSIYLNKPILTSPNTYTSKKAHELGLGFDVDFSDSVHLDEALFNWYNKLNFPQIANRTEKEEVQINKNNELFYSLFRRVINDEVL